MSFGTILLPQEWLVSSPAEKYVQLLEYTLYFLS
jgi:hypothetical protein